MNAAQPVFCVSDHTGLTAEGLAHSVMARFESIEPRYEIRPFVNTVEQAKEIAAEIDELADTGPPPIVFTTLVDPEARRVLQESQGIVLGSYDELVEAVAEVLGVEPGSRVGGYHGVHDLHSYQVRVDALDFALATDDGVGLGRYPSADVIVLGVSRVGKTPTCLYLSMHFGVRAANYPLTQEDLDAPSLPRPLEAHRDKLFGLTIDAGRLHEIRQRRRPDSSYSSMDTVLSETAMTERIFRTHDIPYLDTTNLSIEEIAVTVMRQKGIDRRID